MNEIETGIAHKYYNSLIVEVGDDTVLMISFDEMIHDLDLKTIYISTVDYSVGILVFQEFNKLL